jgi:hypothetical protein
LSSEKFSCIVRAFRIAIICAAKRPDTRGTPGGGS